MEAEDEGHHHHRLCDYCESSIALIYCKADSAKLCFSCDKQVHVTNQLFSKHFRSLLCDSCDDSPSTVFCEIESSVLCQNCDWQLHSSSSSSSSSSSLHTRRRPIEGFSGCPSVTEFLSLVGIDDLSDKALSFTDSESSELLLWETPEIVSLNDLIDPNGSGHNFRAMDVPPLPKNRHATCGKHKEEMIKQLRELARTEPSCLKYETVDAKVDTEFKFTELTNDDRLFWQYEVNGMKWFEDQQDEDIPHCSMVKNLSESDNVDRRDCPRDTMMVPVSNCVKSTIRCHEINSFERHSALSRYKEKKKSRRFEKHIRYESRKIRAESRTRIRGRFAKADP